MAPALHSLRRRRLLVGHEARLRPGGRRRHRPLRPPARTPRPRAPGGRCVVEGRHSGGPAPRPGRSAGTRGSNCPRLLPGIPLPVARRQPHRLLKVGIAVVAAPRPVSRAHARARARASRRRWASWGAHCGRLGHSERGRPKQRWLAAVADDEVQRPAVQARPRARLREPAPKPAALCPSLRGTGRGLGRRTSTYRTSASAAAAAASFTRAALLLTAANWGERQREGPGPLGSTKQARGATGPPTSRNPSSSTGAAADGPLRRLPAALWTAERDTSFWNERSILPCSAMLKSVRRTEGPPRSAPGHGCAGAGRWSAAAARQ